MHRVPCVVPTQDLVQPGRDGDPSTSRARGEVAVVDQVQQVPVRYGPPFQLMAQAAFLSLDERTGMMRDQGDDLSGPAQFIQILRAIQRMESGAGCITGVPHVMQPGRRPDHLRRRRQ